jgi:hypothetical protein
LILQAQKEWKICGERVSNVRASVFPLSARTIADPLIPTLESGVATNIKVVIAYFAPSLFNVSRDDSGEG